MAEKAVILEELQKVTLQRDKLEMALQRRSETEFVTLVQELLDDRLRQLEEKMAALFLPSEVSTSELDPVDEDESFVSLQPPYSIEVAKRLFSGDSNEVDGDSRAWRYIDLEGIMQGPFPGLLMTRWYSSGHFRNPQLMVCCTVPDIDDSQLDVRLHFLKLGQLLKVCEAGEAFQPLTAEDLLSGAAIAPATPARTWERRGRAPSRCLSFSSESPTSSTPLPGRLARHWSGGDALVSKEQHAWTRGNRLDRKSSMEESQSSALGAQQQGRRSGVEDDRFSLDGHQSAVANVQQAGLEAIAALDAAAMRVVTARKEDLGQLHEELVAIRARLDLSPSRAALPAPDAASHSKTSHSFQLPSPKSHHIFTAAPVETHVDAKSDQRQPRQQPSHTARTLDRPSASCSGGETNTAKGSQGGQLFRVQKMAWETKLVDGKLVWSGRFLETSRTKRMIKRVAHWASHCF